MQEVLTLTDSSLTLIGKNNVEPLQTVVLMELVLRKFTETTGQNGGQFKCCSTSKEHQQQIKMASLKTNMN